MMSALAYALIFFRLLTVFPWSINQIRVALD